MRRTGFHKRCASSVLALLLGVATPLAASSDNQHRSSSDPQPAPQESRPSADFLFGRPRGSIGVRGSWNLASAGSDLFDFVTRQLTIDKSDFNAPGFGADVGINVSPRVDTQFGFFFSRLLRPSEYRDLVDNNFLPITQSTSLKTMQLTGSVRFALTPRGHDVSRFAWVPNRFVPFAGAGGGAVFYDFRQSGDFVDFQDLSVFRDAFRSQGWAPSAHVFGGIDMQLYRGLYGTIEGRYTKASATLGPDFIDFNPIDLSGFRLSAGVHVLFDLGSRRTETLT